MLLQTIEALFCKYRLFCYRKLFSAVREKLEADGFAFLSADKQMVPQNTVALPDEETLTKVQKLLDMLEDNDDVQNVWHNAELPEEDDED